MKKRYLACMALAAVAAVAQQPAGLQDILAKLAKYEYGQSRTPLIDLAKFVRTAGGSAVEREQAEAALDTFLESDATRYGKDAVCRELSLMGSERSLPVLLKLLADERTAEPARYALERIPGPKVDAALRAAIGRSGGKTKIGIINTLGRRGDAAAVPVLQPFLEDSDGRLVAAAADALAKVGTAPARAALADALAKSTGPKHVEIAEASIRCADRRVQQGERAAALAIYKSVYQPSEPVMLRITALTGLAAASGESSLPVLEAAADQEEPRLRMVAVRLLAGLPGPAAAKALLARMRRFPPDLQVQALSGLTDRGDRTARRAFRDILKAPDTGVRVAALEGLGKIGDKTDVMVLAHIAANATGEEQDAARQSLNTLRGRDIDEAVVAGLSAGDAKVRVESIRAAGERAIRAAAVPLLAAAKDVNPEVRREAIRALRDTAGPEQTPALIALLRSVRESSERRDAQRALLSAIKQAKAPCAPELVEAYRAAGDRETKAGLMQVMAQTGSDDTLPLFREVLAQGDDESRRVAIDALSQWTAATPAPDLLQAARNGVGPAHQILALRGYIKLVALPADRPPAETAKMLGGALQLATQTEEKRAVLAALQRAPSAEALQLAESALKDPAVTQEAQAAVNALKRALSQK